MTVEENLKLKEYKELIEIIYYDLCFSILWIIVETVIASWKTYIPTCVAGNQFLNDAFINQLIRL